MTKGTDFEVGQVILFGYNDQEIVGTITRISEGKGPTLIHTDIPDPYFEVVDVSCWDHQVIKILTEEDDPEYFI